VTAAELVLVVAAVLCAIGFAALVVVLVRVLDTLRDVRAEVDQLRAETTPLMRELLETTDEARAAVDEARADLERFDRVLGSAEAIGDAVGGRVARTSFSSPMIKAAGLARGTSRTISRLRGTSTVPRVVESSSTVSRVGTSNSMRPAIETSSDRKRKRA
jgi:uncharacterized protein YoxC